MCIQIDDNEKVENFSYFFLWGFSEESIKQRINYSNKSTETFYCSLNSTMQYWVLIKSYQ